MEKLPQGVGSILKNLGYVSLYHQLVKQKIQRYGVADNVSRERAAIAGLERMLVDPLPVGPPK
ncbi:MAG: hypothetical protein ACI9OD_005260, partial [Limisphaerales bacterium]